MEVLEPGVIAGVRWLDAGGRWLDAGVLITADDVALDGDLARAGVAAARPFSSARRAAAALAAASSAAAATSAAS